MRDLDTLIEKGKRLTTRNKSLAVTESDIGQIWFYSRSQISNSDELQTVYGQYDDKNIGYGLESSMNAYLIGLAKGYQYREVEKR